MWCKNACDLCWWWHHSNCQHCWDLLKEMLWLVKIKLSFLFVQLHRPLLRSTHLRPLGICGGPRLASPALNVLRKAVATNLCSLWLGFGQDWADSFGYSDWLVFTVLVLIPRKEKSVYQLANDCVCVVWSYFFKSASGAGAVAQAIECLPSVCKALGLIPILHIIVWHRWFLWRVTFFSLACCWADLFHCSVLRYSREKVRVKILLIFSSCMRHCSNCTFTLFPYPPSL